MRETEGEPQVGRWTRRLVLFLRMMAAVSMVKGVYHWARCLRHRRRRHLRISVDRLQTATIFFAVIDLVAAVGCGWRRPGAR